jgi:putative transposase
VEPDVRDGVVDFVHKWEEKTELPRCLFLKGIGLFRNKFRSWEKRYGMDNFHNGKIPRDFWLESWERDAIVKYYKEHKEVGYRSLSYMMLDEDVVAVSPATTYRVLKDADLLNRWNRKASSKGQGFSQPGRAHEHWHIDISYINICGTFYYFIGILDGYSRFIVHWDIRESMREHDVEIVLQKARELYPEARPRIISDNGPQFISKDFKSFIRLAGMSHVCTSPYYPQSNGKLERWHRTLKEECIRPLTPLSLEDAKRLVTDFVMTYNCKRLHSSIGFVTPYDRLTGRDKQIFAERDRKLEAARDRRKAARGNRVHDAVC